jgi:TonB family protein
MSPHDRWFDGIARDLIGHAARKAPPALSERLGEEWLADLAARSGSFSQLRFALGCCWATTVIAHEFGAPVRAATTTAAVNNASVVHHAGSGPSFSRRTTVVLLIVGLHVLAICLLTTAIVAPKVPKANPPPRIDVSFLPRPPSSIPPLPSDPKFTQIRPDIPPPQWMPEVTADPQITVQSPVTEMQPTAAGTLTPQTVNRVSGGPGAGFPNTEDFYPQASRRLGETGITTVNVCVDGSGRLLGKPTIDHSSGSATLDEGALRLAKAGAGHYRATTEDGHPVSACYPFRVRFKLRD